MGEIAYVMAVSMYELSKFIIVQYKNLLSGCIKYIDYMMNELEYYFYNK